LRSSATPFQRNCFSQIGINLNSKADDVAEKSFVLQVACPHKSQVALLAFISLNSFFIFPVSVKILLATSFAEWNKRTFFIAKAIQVCLYHFTPSGQRQLKLPASEFFEEKGD